MPIFFFSSLFPFEVTKWCPSSFANFSHKDLTLLTASKDQIWQLAICQESRSRKSAQDAKWNFCLTAGTMGPRIRREHEQTRTPEPHRGLQGEGGACRRQGRSNGGPACRAVRRPPQPNHSVEGTA